MATRSSATGSPRPATDPYLERTLARIEHVSTQFPDRVCASDEFGPLTIRPQPGAGWAPRSRSARATANCR